MGEPWFGAKAHGIGIGPKSLAGWLSTAIYLGLMLVTLIAAIFLRWPVWIIPIGLGLFTIAFLTLVALKSSDDPLRWRWGRK